jgi:hypothetical protein
MVEMVEGECHQETGVRTMADVAIIPTLSLMVVVDQEGANDRNQDW